MVPRPLVCGAPRGHHGAAQDSAISPIARLEWSFLRRASGAENLCALGDLNAVAAVYHSRYSGVAGEFGPNARAPVKTAVGSHVSCAPKGPRWARGHFDVYVGAGRKVGPGYADMSCAEGWGPIVAGVYYEGRHKRSLHECVTRLDAGIARLNRSPARS